MIIIINNLCGNTYFRGTAGGGGGGGGGGRDGVGEVRGRYSYLGGGCDHSAAMPILAMHLIGRFRS